MSHPDPSKDKPGLRAATKIKIVISALLATFLAAFVVLNMEVVEVNILIARIEVRRSVMIVGVFLIGFLVGWTVRAVFGVIGRAKH